MIVQTVTEQWIEPSEIRKLFDGPKVEAEVDDELGLPIVAQETMEEKYGLSNLKDNSFTRSLREQFERKGRLSEKQVNCLR